MTKIAAYLRVSTNEQSTDNQLPAIKAWCESRGYGDPTIYSESESAWKSGRQKALSQLLADLRSGKRKFDIVLVWSLDRLTRAGIAEILHLVNTLKGLECQVVSIQESWTEQSGPMADLLYAITAWVAQFESQRRSERTRAGLSRAVANGSKLGRPKGSKDKEKRKRGGYLLRHHPELRG